jgi:hypothetical protein
MKRLLLALLLLWFSLPAAAQVYGPPCGNADACDQGEAFSACMATASAITLTTSQQTAGYFPLCIVATGTASSETGTYRPCMSNPGGAQGNCAKSGTPDQKWFSSCSTRPDEPDWQGTSSVCSAGCRYDFVFDTAAPGGGQHSPSGATCKVGEFPPPETPPPDRDNDGVPDVDDDFPDDPTESNDSDGDGVGDNSDTDDEDPDNGKDDGTGDESDNAASGGGTCDAPPQCSGDAIQCNQLHQQWQMRCKGAKVTGSPEVCNASYTCTGDTAQCAEIALLRVTACKNVTTNPGDGGAAQELVDGLKNGPADKPDYDPKSIWGEDDEEAEADDTGFGLARSCPPPISVFGRTIGMPCDLGLVVAAIVLLAGFVQFGYAFIRS